MKNVFIPNHPLVSHNLALIRDKNSKREIFLSAFQRVSFFLIQEGLKHLPQQEVEIETP
jgi:uracil phosphoribosyltransferase